MLANKRRIRVLLTARVASSAYKPCDPDRAIGATLKFGHTRLVTAAPAHLGDERRHLERAEHWELLLNHEAVQVLLA